MKSLIFLALLLCAPLLAFAIRAAVVHRRANRKPPTERDIDAYLAGNRNRRVEREMSTRREILRKLLASGGALKR